MDVHPLFDQSGVADLTSIRKLFPQSNLATAKINQRTPSKAALAAAAAISNIVSDKKDEKKEQEKKEEEVKELKIIEPPAELFDPAKNPYFDPKISAKAAMPKQRVSGKGFKFIQKGKFVEQANRMRQQVSDLRVNI